MFALLDERGSAMLRTAMLSVGFWVCLLSVAAAQSREEKVRGDRQRVEAAGQWIYGDMARGFAEARRSGKPIVVVLRCLPCEECVKLDDDLIQQDERIGPLLDQFVRVRLVSTNGLDLSLFQFDYDQSFAVFFLNADGTIYGRFGTRSHRTQWSDDVSLAGLAEALRGTLELHRDYPNNKPQLVGKQGPPPEFGSPEKYPLLREKYGPQLDYEGAVVQSCIHCHQIGDAQRQLHRTRREPLPAELLFSYPHPKAIGLVLDPAHRATVREVAPQSAAERAGLQMGDVIQELAGQPLVSIADVQWILHRTPADGGEIKIKIQRDNRAVQLKLRLSAGWRERDDLSWRASTWALRRMATGGLQLEAASIELRRDAGIADDKMALRIKHVGQYGPHAAAKQAGFQVGDILLGFDGRTNLLRETDLLSYALQQRRPGDRVPVIVLRDREKRDLMLPMQD